MTARAEWNPAFLAALFFGLFVAAHTSAQGTPPPLHAIAQVRALDRFQAQRGRKVSLDGTVLVLPAWKNSFFFTDGHAGISVDRESALPIVHSGDAIHLEGVTGDGKFAPVINGERVIVTGRHALPRARIFTPEELAGGRQDSQWIAIRGVVRSATAKMEIGHLFLMLVLDMGRGNLITARIVSFPSDAAAKLSGATVKVRGVCGSVFNTRRQFVGPRLFVQDAADISIEHPAPADPFSIATTSLSDVLRFDDQQKGSERLKVEGTVTYIKPDAGLYLQDGKQGVWVQTDHSVPVSVGTRVMALGYSQTGAYSPVLSNAMVAETAGHAPVVQAMTPSVISASALLAAADGFQYAPFDALLVRVQGKLLQFIPGTKEDLLLLEDEGFVFTAKVPGGFESRADAVSVGSVIAVTGICTAVTDASHEARSIELLLRSASDITLLRKPAQWNAAMATRVAVGLFAVLCCLLIWIVIMRRRTRLHELIALDPLTGVFNRRGFVAVAQQRWQAACRSQRSVLLLFIDLDRFKQINDSFGHQIGDGVLQSVAGLLQSSFKKSAVIGRLGGDEFAVFAFDEADVDETATRQRLERSLQQSNARQNTALAVGLSVGTLPCDASMAHLAIEDLLARADSLMYDQKRLHHGQERNSILHAGLPSYG